MSLSWYQTVIIDNNNKKDRHYTEKYREYTGAFMNKEKSVDLQLGSWKGKSTSTDVCNRVEDTVNWSMSGSDQNT